MLVELFRPSLSRIESIDPTAFRLYYLVPAGIAICHLPTLAGAIVRRSTGSERVDDLIRVIEKAELSPEERRQQYRLLIQRVLDEVALSAAAQAQMAAGERILAGADTPSEIE